MFHRFIKRRFNAEETERVFQFFSSFQDFRTDKRCSTVTGLDLPKVKAIRAHLYDTGRLGAYSLGLTGPPHALMRTMIHKEFDISKDAAVLEVGPGSNPLFPRELYPNVKSIDKYAARGAVLPYGNVKGQESVADFQGSYSTIDELGISGFDVVAGCHSFEHETRPLKGLRNVRSVLKPGGLLILFVPDGWSDDLNFRAEVSHTMDLTPAMIEEFFAEVGGFDVSVKPFRPNWDYVVTARPK